MLFEDFVATFGAIVAMIGIGLSHWTGNPIFDSITSIVIGAMLGIMAVWLGWRNRELILGPAIPDDVQQEVLKFLQDQPSVEAVRKFRTRVVAADTFRIAAEIDYDGVYLGKKHAKWLQEQAKDASGEEAWQEIAGEFGERLMQDLGVEVDDVEAKLAAQFPEIRHIDMEAD